MVKDDQLFFFSFFLSLHLSFPHATDQTLLAKFKQQHQGNKYFVPTPVMEPAFVIQHFAGKVKYQVKVRMMSKDCFFYFICVVIGHILIFLLCYNATGFSGEEHGPHAFGHCSVVKEQWQRLCAATHWHGPSGHVSMGNSACHYQRTGCFQWSRQSSGRQDFRCIIIVNFSTK